MFQYYFRLALRSLRRNPVLTGLMVLTLAIGVAASIATLTILHVMSGDPIPGKSDRLIAPLLDVAPARSYVPGKREPYGNQTTYKDAMAFLASGQGVRRTVLYDVNGSVETGKPGQPVVDLQGIATTRDYFAMFEAPLLRGTPWSVEDEKRAATVAILSKRKAEALFGNADPVGQRLRVWGRDFTVVGVVDDWRQLPRYTHLVNATGGEFAGEEDVYIPFATAIALEFPNYGSTTCSHESGVGFQGLLASECIWLQPWFELSSAADRPALQAWIDDYAREQQRLGRLERKAPNRLFNVREWLEWMEVVRNDSRVAVWLAFGFLLLCMVNTMGLLLAKFSVRSAEVGVRRALGATRGAIFRQFLVEAGVIGLAGGVSGLVLAAGSLWLIRGASRDLAVVAHMDWAMLAATFAIAVGASLVAGLLPTWRATQVTPALQLKSQ
ncbi:ABC transporter permease [Ramlibacter sp. XY19]|uniref:ABC transporter permease n=1 Tax=Ramlibacter paludis TaxID=2908000 RepID=UPI0023DA205E|nr:ABC transporter permease [Ramlibacter paludis]MCG2595662.1 ABC transporter permease [Ramlibacter paludis]